MRRAVSTALALSALLATAASAASVSQSFTQTARVSLQATPSGCDNNPGPFITLNGELTLSGASARITLSNNAKGTHTATTDVTADVVILPAGQSIQIAKQPSRGGVGGNPWIYLQFTNGQGGALGTPMLLGRCVQGLTNADATFQIPAGVTGSVTSGDCSGAGGPFVTLNGELRLGGLNAQLILTNNAKFTHATAVDVVVDVVLIPEGQSITFAKQPPLGGAGGNPIISIQFIGGSGEPLGSKIVLGRCNQL